MSGLCDDAYFQKEGFCLPHTHINFPSCLSLLSPHQQNPAQALTAPSIRSQQRESHSFSPSSCADPSCGGDVRKGEYVRVAACVCIRFALQLVCESKRVLCAFTRHPPLSSPAVAVEGCLSFLCLVEEGEQAMCGSAFLASWGCLALGIHPRALQLVLLLENTSSACQVTQHFHSSFHSCLFLEWVEGTC